MKRFLTLLLAVAMVASCFVFAAVAIDAGEIRPITITEAKIINDKEIELTFSENVKYVADTAAGEPVFCGIRLLDANGNYNTATNGGVWQWWGKLSITDGTNKGHWTMTRAGAGTLKSILALSISGYTPTLVIEGKPYKDITSPVEGFVDNIQSVDGTGMLKADILDPVAKDPNKYIYERAICTNFTNLEALDIGKPEPKYDMAVTVGDGREGVDIVSVKVLDAKTLEIKFSEKVKKVGNVDPWVSIRYVTVDAAGTAALVYHNGKPLQFTGTSNWPDNSDTMTYTINNLKGILDFTAADIGDLKGLQVAFSIEGKPDDGIANPVHVYIDQIQSVDGKRLLKGTPGNKDTIPDRNAYDGWYGVIQDTEKAGSSSGGQQPSTPTENAKMAVTVGDGREGVDIVSVKVIDTKTLEIKFSEKVKRVGSVEPWVSIRYVTVNSSGTAALAYYNGKPLQFVGTSKWPDNSDTMTYTIDNLANILALQGADIGTLENLQVAFSIEGKPDDSIANPVHVYIDQIQSVDGKKLLKGTPGNKDTIPGRNAYDGWYGVIQDVEKAGKADPPPEKPEVDPVVNPTGEIRPITITDVKVLNSMQMEITFSEKINFVADLTLGEPVFCGIRLLDANGNYNTSTNGGNWQWWGKIEVTNGTNKAKCTITKTGAGTLQEILALKIEGYTPTFVIEAKPYAGVITKPLLGWLDNFRSLDGQGLLKADNLNGNSPEWERAYSTKFSGVENASKPYGNSTVRERPYVTLESATVINANQIALKFSEPVVVVGNNKDQALSTPVFAAVRYTTGNYNVVKHPTDGYLQFQGQLSGEGTDTLIWTARSNWGKTLEMVLNKSGYEDEDYDIYFCFEGMPANDIESPEVGYIDNIQSVDGEKLLLSDPKKLDTGNGIYDGLYVKMADTEKAESVDAAEGIVTEGVFIKGIYTVDDTTLKVVFSEPVNSYGAGTISTQNYSVLSSIRYANRNLEALPASGGRKHEYKGTLTFDGTDTAIFELWSNVKLTIPELMNMQGLEFDEDATDTYAQLILYIEGTEDVDEIPEPVPTFIDNVRTEDGKMLRALKYEAFGVKDATYSTEFLGAEPAAN